MMSPSFKSFALSVLLVVNVDNVLVQASSSRYDSSNYGMYQQSGKSTWMSNSKSLSYQVKGCVWAVTEGNEDYGCLADSSEDGTYSWYQMANCRRAQVAYNVYGSSSSSTSCNSGNFKESYHSQIGLIGFVSTVSNYYSNYYVSYNDVYNLPGCGWNDSAGSYVDIGCGTDGSFVLAKFSDQYCLSPTGSTYNTLSDLNTKFNKMANKCQSGDDVLEDILQYSESCSPLDNALCGDDDGSKVSTYKSSTKRASTSSSANTQVSEKMQTVANTVKYALGSCFLLASFIMFLGILMMNRRKRRANLNRKFRQSSSGKSGRSQSRSSRSRSRSKSQSARSKSRDKTGSSEKKVKAEDGVYA